MGRRYRRGFSSSEKTEMWDRWQRVESLRAIGRAFGKPSSSIHFQISPHGGASPSEVGIDAVGARDDIARDCRTAVDPIDGKITGPLTFDGEP